MYIVPRLTSNYEQIKITNINKNNLQQKNVMIYCI